MVVLLAVFLVVFSPATPSAQADSGPQLIVTSTADPPTGAACPDATKCTLRRAIQVANADTSPERFTILFSTAVFPPATPATIALTAALPPVTRNAVTIDARAAGVIVDGSSASGIGDGIILAGNQAAIGGVGFARFPGACLVVTGEGAVVGGDASANEGNRFVACGTGIRLAGPGAVVLGNTVGLPFSTTEASSTTSVGILVTAAHTALGPSEASPSRANVIGRTTVAIRVGDGPEPAFTGTVVAYNYIGRDLAGSPAPAGTGIQLRQPSSGTRAVANVIANTSVAGIQVAPDSGGHSVTGNTFTSNRFSLLAGMPIDLNADGVRNALHSGELSAGPNLFRNYPVISRAVQARVTGDAGCPGCSVELYLALHTPGGAIDYGSEPLAVTVADSAGAFSFTAPPVAPGQWVTALTTDLAGNTSEFGPATRVGAGVLQCGNVTLQPGWNNVGYFGPTPLALDEVFPPGASSSGSVRAIYHLDDGAGTYTRWLAGVPAGRTLSTLEPGEAYWFLADGPITLPAGFSLTVGVPVQLQPGWNDFVYIGATADVRDALSSLPAFGDLYRFDNDGSLAGFSAYGRAETPSWARDFDQLESCRTYLLYVDSAMTLLPLQP